MAANFEWLAVAAGLRGPPTDALSKQGLLPLIVDRFPPGQEQ